MLTSHDDLPHPVPPHAFLRYKENYFFIILAPDQNVFGVFHLNHEPGFDSARYTAHMRVNGKLLSYSNRTPFPENFAFSRRIGDGCLGVEFLEPHKTFRLTLSTNEINLDVTMTARQPTYSFIASMSASLDNPTYNQVQQLGINFPWNHQQQSLDSQGSVELLREGRRIRIGGSGYRDHSWVTRADNLVASHVWAGLNFADFAIGVKQLDTMIRPGYFAKEGYIADQDGVRTLKRIKMTEVGGTPGLPDKIVHELEDVLGGKYVIESDIKGRLADVPLIAEAAPGRPAYNIVENFCRIKLAETGEVGIGLVEIGRNAQLAEMAS